MWYASYWAQAALLADQGVENATHSELRQTLASMQDSHSDFIAAAQHAGMHSSSLAKEIWWCHFDVQHHYQIMLWYAIPSLSKETWCHHRDLGCGHCQQCCCSMACFSSALHCPAVVLAWTARGSALCERRDLIPMVCNQMAFEPNSVWKYSG